MRYGSKGIIVKYSHTIFYINIRTILLGYNYVIMIDFRYINLKNQ